MATKKKTKKNLSSFVNNSIDFTLLGVVIALLSLGLVMVLSASSPSALSQSGNSYAFFSKQLLFAGLGLVFMIAISKIDYRKYQKWYLFAFGVSVFLLVAVLLVGRTINFAKRWIYITETISFQPSEIVKFLMIIFYAGYLTQHRDDLRKFGKGFLLSLVPLGIIALLLMKQPHFSALIVIGGISCIMMIMAGCKLSHFVGTGLTVGIPALTFLVITAPYRLERVKTFMNPWKYATDEGWQVIQSLYAIGSGGLFGVGLGDSKQKFLYIPEPHNDFIFSILGEELGFIGCAIVIILFAIFIWRGIVIAMKAPDMFGSLIAIGIVAQVAIQVIINIAVVTSSMPATGMPLPFFSYGGTALFFLLCEMGVLLNISRASNK